MSASALRIVDAQPAAARNDAYDPRLPKLVNLRDLAENDPPAREWLVDSIVPRSANVLLSANGGTGKSLLSLTLAVCVAQGRPFYGLPTKQTRVVAWMAEDDRGEIHRRLAAICAHEGIGLADLDGWLYVYDGVGADCALFGRRTDVDVNGRPLYLAEPDSTTAWGWLKHECHRLQAEFVILDSTSDTFDAEENRRPHVRRYMNLALATVLERRGSVLHVAHVDKMVARGGAANGQTYTGSTAWNNSCRARLALSRPGREDGDDATADDGRRVLTVEKINYGRPGLTIPLVYDHDRHVFVRDGDASDSGIVGSIRARTERMAVLQCLEASAAAGRSVMVSRQANDNAATLLGPMDAFPRSMRSKAGRRRLFDLLTQFEVDGLIEREGFKTASRHAAERWRVTDTGRREIAGTA